MPIFEINHKLKRFSDQSASPTASDPALLDSATDKDRLIRLAKEIVSRTPEVRKDRVARLQLAIEHGAYKIDCRKLAEIITSYLI